MTGFTIENRFWAIPAQPVSLLQNVTRTSRAYRHTGEGRRGAALAVVVCSFSIRCPRCLASYDDNKIACYENGEGADPDFEPREITRDAEVAYAVYVADLDGDGDLDVVSASEGDNKIAWYENGGQAVPVWNTREITRDARWAYGVHVADLDGDGDLDVVSASFDDNKTAWYENGFKYLSRGGKGRLEKRSISNHR